MDLLANVFEDMRKALQLDAAEARVEKMAASLEQPDYDTAARDSTNQELLERGLIQPEDL